MTTAALLVEDTGAPQQWWHWCATMFVLALTTLTPLILVKYAAVSSSAAALGLLLSAVVTIGVVCFVCLTGHPDAVVTEHEAESAADEDDDDNEWPLLFLLRSSSRGNSSSI